MKQASNAIKSFFLGSPRYPSIHQKVVFPKYLLVLLLAGISIAGSGFQKESRIISSQKEKLLKPSVPFKGRYTFDINTNSGTGTGSHIRTFSIVEPNNSVVPNSDGSLVVTGTAIITAANGDKIFATHSGLITFNDDGTAQVNAEFATAGGTGRFIRAIGSFESNGLLNLALGTLDATFDGEISY